MFYQIFFSPQVKSCAIITYELGIYELPQELPNELGNIRSDSLVPSYLAKMKILLILGKNSWNVEIKLFS